MVSLAQRVREVVEPLCLAHGNGFFLGGGWVEPGGAELVKLTRGRGDGQDAGVGVLGGFLTGGPGERESFKG